MEGSVTVIGERGTVKVGGTALNRIEHWEFAEYHDDDRAAEALRAVSNPVSLYGSGHLPYYENVVKVLCGEAAPGTDGREGRKSLELILGIYESARTTKIWHFCHVMAGAVIGERCSLGQNVMVGRGVRLGSNVKVQNNVSIYEGVECEDDVFLGPSMVFTNVVNPRSHVSRKHEYRPTLVRQGASIGANATIVCGHTLGEYAFVAAGAVVTKDVPDFALVAGVPARVIGWVCRCGERLRLGAEVHEGEDAVCAACGEQYVGLAGGLRLQPTAPAQPRP
jgi:UDP-2-acetamido-3-amino-2,3-dideoxy-glucuronate N-acetyltransferase